MSESVDQVKKETRLRVWVAIFYPESTKPDWRKILQDNFICCSVSPLHDKDIYESDDDDHKAGDYKKPHYHIVFRFSGSKSFHQVWDILKLISLDGCCPPPQIPHGDINRCVQYHIHYNDKSKAQYLRSEIISINGFDVDRCFQLNSEQEEQLFDSVFCFICQNQIYEYWDLISLLRDAAYSGKDQFFDDMLKYARTHTILFTSLLKSRSYSAKKREGEKQ